MTGVFSFRISVKPHKRCVCVAGENTSVLCLKGQWLVAEQQQKNSLTTVDILLGCPSVTTNNETRFIFMVQPTTRGHLNIKTSKLKCTGTITKITLKYLL